jgi:hypothetical protein
MNYSDVVKKGLEWLKERREGTRKLLKENNMQAPAPIRILDGVSHGGMAHLSSFD